MKDGESPDIEDLVRSISEKHHENSSNILKPEVFDFNYVPGKLFIRDDAKMILESILNFQYLGVPNNLFIYGARGSGKTVLVRYLVSRKEVLEKISYPIRYVNCRFNNTSFKLLSEILGINCRGLGSFELMSKLKENYPKMLIILDEIDLLEDRDALYYLSRSENKYMLILLSNNPNYFHKIDQATKSSLQLERMYFKNYDALQVTEILNARSMDGLKNSYDDCLPLIAGLTVRECNGDVRIAIKTLFYLASGKYSDVRTNFDRARDDIFVDMLSNQNDQVLLILSSICRNKGAYVKNIYGAYKTLCESLQFKPFSYMHFYNNLGYLQSIGLVILISTNSKSGNPNRAEPLFNVDILREIAKNRFNL